MGLIIPRSSVRSWHLALSAAPAKRATRGGDRTHNLRLRKPTRFHCATRACKSGSWSCWGSNPGPSPYQSDALPTELHDPPPQNVPCEGVALYRPGAAAGSMYWCRGSSERGAQQRSAGRCLLVAWLNGRALDLGSNGCRFESDRFAAHGYLAQWQSTGPVNLGSRVRSSQWPFPPRMLHMAT